MSAVLDLTAADLQVGDTITAREWISNDGGNGPGIGHLIFAVERAHAPISLPTALYTVISVIWRTDVPVRFAFERWIRVDADTWQAVGGGVQLLDAELLAQADAVTLLNAGAA